MVDIQVANAESDSELKTKAMKQILDRICRKYLADSDPTFNQEEVKEQLRGLGPEYVDLIIMDLLRGSGVLEIDNDYNLTLNKNGKRLCKKGDLYYR
jgi:hypothetical protein